MAGQEQKLEAVGYPPIVDWPRINFEYAWKNFPDLMWAVFPDGPPGPNDPRAEPDGLTYVAPIREFLVEIKNSALELAGEWATKLCRMAASNGLYEASIVGNVGFGPSRKEFALCQIAGFVRLCRDSLYMKSVEWLVPKIKSFLQAPHTIDQLFWALLQTNLTDEQILDSTKPFRPPTKRTRRVAEVFVEHFGNSAAQAAALDRDRPCFRPKNYQSYTEYHHNAPESFRSYMHKCAITVYGKEHLNQILAQKKNGLQKKQPQALSPQRLSTTSSTNPV